MSQSHRYHKSWSSSDQEYFEKIILAHGGWSSWDSLDSVNFRLETFSGALVFVKGLNRTFFNPTKIVVKPKNQKVEFFYGDDSDIYQEGKIQLQGQSTKNGQDFFRRGTFEQWSKAHATYFFGYAWSNYLSYPFSLPKFELISRSMNKGISALQISFPKEHHTHSRDQTFYFDKNNLLYRHDYRAEFAGPFVYGAHYTEGYVKYKNIEYATVRKVKPRMGDIPLPLNGIYGRLLFLES